MTAADARPHHDTPCGVLSAAFDRQVSQQSLTRWADKLGPADAVLLAETVTRYVQVVRNRHDREIADVFDEAIAARAAATREAFGHRFRPDLSDPVAMATETALIETYGEVAGP